MENELLSHRTIPYYIDTKQFNVYKTKPEGIDCFRVDPWIADTISILNKKGYITELCCGGHVPWYNIINSYKLSNKKEFKRIQEGDYEIISTDKNNFYFVIGIAICSIIFNKNVELKSVPEGFEKDKVTRFDGSKAWMVSARIPSYHQENGIAVRKCDETVKAEIESVNKKLREWAISLPNLLKNNDNSCEAEQI